MEILTFMAANPWLSFFVMVILYLLIAHLSTIIRDAYINTIWCLRGMPPIAKVDVPTAQEIDKEVAKIIQKKKEEDENQLKDCR